MGDLENAIAKEFEKLSGRVAIVAEECGHDLNDEVWMARMLHISEQLVDSATGKEPNLSDLALAMALNVAVDRRFSSTEDALKFLCLGNWMAGMASILATTVIREGPGYDFLLESIKSEMGRHAVSHRKDQTHKEGWIVHCRRVKESGIEVRTIGDLLNIDGYPVEAASIPAPTLKKWAKEVGFRFHSGRPKGK